jgi:hypothetical protein
MSELINNNKSNNTQKENKETDTFEVDKLQLYFGEPFQISDKIIIRQPTIGQIMEYGEKKFYSMLNVFISNPTSYRLMLWDIGIDWNKISDYKLFSMLIKSLKQEDTSILFGDLNFQLFDMYEKQINEDEQYITLYNKEQDVEINETTYKHIALYLRTMFNIFPKVEKAKGKGTKEAIIDEDRMNANLRKDEQYQSMLLPLISSCLNHPGTNYTKKQLKDEVGIFEFMDCVQRLQIYESTVALMHGMYSGMVDTSGINKEEFNFMRDIKTH